MTFADQVEVEVHPADSDKVVVWDLNTKGERTGSWTTCDNLDGAFDEMLPENVAPMHRPGVPFATE